MRLVLTVFCIYIALTFVFGMLHKSGEIVISPIVGIALGLSMPFVFLITHDYEIKKKRETTKECCP